ncbi:hypothetical protein RQN30_10705 [Arcanobacterium hippocoleae]
MSNHFTKDRQQITSTLESIGMKVDANQPEVIYPNQILLESASYKAGQTFNAFEATYRAIVVLKAHDAQSALKAADTAINAICDATAKSYAADLTEISELYNLQDGQMNIYPAFNITLISQIDLNERK